MRMPEPRCPFEWRDTSCGRVLVSAALSGVAPHLFATRSLTLRGPSADDEWAQLAAVMGVAPERMFAPKQVHGADVLVVGASDTAPSSLNDPNRPRADIILTNDPATAVAVQSADCVPLLLADRKKRVVAAAHAGWRGTAAGVARRAVEAMARHFGSRPDDIVAAIGPSIAECCYQVGKDVLDEFAGAGIEQRWLESWFRAEEQAGRFLLDVPAANRDQLIQAGVAPEHVAVSGLCTRCHPEVFFSYRREGPGTGRMASAIRLPAR